MAAQCLAALLLTPLLALSQGSGSGSQGRFQGSTDIGHAQPGASLYNPAMQTYTIRGGGADVWGAADDFRFTWARMSGDETLTAEVQVSQPSTYPKAKGMLMIRQSLDPGSPYADIAIHGDGHITLQYRLTPGGETKDIDLPEHGAVRLRIERKGDRYTATAISAGSGAASGPSITIPMGGSVYVGLGVCSHSTGALQTVTFGHVEITQPATPPSSTY